MMNKRDFLRSSAAAALAGTGAAGALAAVKPRLGAQSGVASWQAHVGQVFEVDGHTLTLEAVKVLQSQQPGEQFNLCFCGELPSSFGDGLRTLAPREGEAQLLYLARTPQGLRADFCRLAPT